MSKRFVYGFLIYMFFGVGSIGLGIDAIFFVAFSVWLLSVYYASRDLRKRVLYLVFLISFFILLMGGHFVYEYFGMELRYYIGDEYYKHSNICLLISLIALFIGFYLTTKTRFKKSRNQVRRNTISVFTNLKTNNNTHTIRKASKWLFYATYVFWIYTVANVASFVLTNSYLSYYVEYESSAPFLVKAIASMTPYFYYLFLATLPSKKECRMSIVLYMTYAAVSLLTGRRINFIIMCMFMALYYVLRHYMRDKEDQWISKQMVTIFVCAVPLLIVFLYAYNYIRLDQSIDNISIKEMFLGFFQQQGFSSNLIRLEKLYESSLREDVYYSFFGIVKHFRTNTILKTIFNSQYDFSYLHNSIEFATKGNSMSNALSYIVLRTYLSGAGLGTCYIAELYHDFGYIGVAAGNLVYGIVINFLGKLWSKNAGYSVWFTAIGFVMVESFIKAPRWNYDIFIAYFLDLGMWMAFAFVFIIGRALNKKNLKLRCQHQYVKSVIAKVQLS